MGWPLGKAPNGSGTGTSPADLQRIIGASYMGSGLLPNGGGLVSGTAGMAYAVAAGTAMMWTDSAQKRGMLVPFEAATVSTDAAPATGSRTDTVYVDGEGAVRVAIGSASAPSGVPIARFTVPAGITATTSASQRLDRDFAIPVGASLGMLTHWQDPGGGAVGPADTVRHQAQFYLPSDRVLRVDVSVVLRSVVSDAPGTCQVGVELVSGTTVWSRWIDLRHGSAWDSRGFALSTVMPEGICTFKLRTRLPAGGGGQFEFAPGGSTPTECSVWDAGVSR